MSLFNPTKPEKSLLGHIARIRLKTLTIAIFFLLVTYIVFVGFSFFSFSRAIDDSTRYEAEYHQLHEITQLIDEASFWMLHYTNSSSVSSKKTAMAALQALKAKISEDRNKGKYDDTYTRLEKITTKLDNAQKQFQAGYDLAALAMIMQASPLRKSIQKDLLEISTDIANGLERSSTQIENTNYLSVPIAIGICCIILLITIMTIRLHQTNRRLSENISLLNSTRSQMVQQEKLASLGSVVAGVAHEINTPLGICITAASAVEQELEATESNIKEGVPVSRNSLLQSISSSREYTELLAENLARSADLVKSFKLIAVDQSSEKKRQFYLGNYISSIIKSLHHEYKKKNISFSCEIDKNIVLDSAPGLFSQIFTNLIMNSIIHGFVNPQEGREIHITCEVKGKSLVIDYRDNGCGISASDRVKVFDPFYTTRRNEGGSGLGMHIVYNLVHQGLGGKIYLDDKCEQGVHFCISLPREIILGEYL